MTDTATALDTARREAHDAIVHAHRIAVEAGVPVDGADLIDFAADAQNASEPFALRQKVVVGGDIPAVVDCIIRCADGAVVYALTWWTGGARNCGEFSAYEIEVVDG